MPQPKRAAWEAEPITANAALEILQLAASDDGVPACLAAKSDDERIPCLLRLRFASDGRAAELAVAHYADLGDVIGMERENEMDGGWRGHIHLVPALPVGAERRHLEWVVAGRRAIDRFFRELTAGESAVPRYRHKPLALAFMRSTAGKRTPSAYAVDWRIAYNLAGSLNLSADAVRETLFHENFHLDDAAHDGWSERALGAQYDALMTKCDVEAHVTLSLACLKPYAPNATTVIGGTYYAFQPGGGVAEYAAELAIRYYREQLAALAGRPTRPPFKCGPAENARAWRAFVAEFFAGIDKTPPCR